MGHVDEERVYLEDRESWREWLREHHGRTSSVWLIYFKKDSGKPRVPYEDAVEEAICFGWIDSTVKRIDDERYMQRFVDRRKGSSWSRLNRKRAEKMIGEGKMTEAGMKKIEEARRSGKWEAALRDESETAPPAALVEALKKDGGAWKNFEAFAPSYRKAYARYVDSAKRDETRIRRIAEVVRLCAENVKPRMQ